MQNITINGKSYIGNSIRVTNNEVWIDGIRANPQPLPDNGILRIDLNGSIESLTSDSSVNVVGQVGQVRASGNVQCGDAGSVYASGNVICRNVSGNVSAGGNVIKSFT